MFEEVEKTEVMGKKRIEKDEKHDTKSKQQKQILKKPAKEENPKVKFIHFPKNQCFLSKDRISLEIKG